jgi:hypothetical protein
MGNCMGTAERQTRMAEYTRRYAEHRHALFEAMVALYEAIDASLRRDFAKRLVPSVFGEEKEQELSRFIEARSRAVGYAEEQIYALQREFGMKSHDNVALFRRMWNRVDRFIDSEDYRPTSPHQRQIPIDIRRRNRAYNRRRCRLYRRY